MPRCVIHFGFISNSVYYLQYLVHFLSTIYFGLLVNEGYDTQRKGKRLFRVYVGGVQLCKTVKLCRENYNTHSKYFVENRGKSRVHKVFFFLLASFEII